MERYYFYSVILSNVLLSIAFIYGVTSAKLRHNKQLKWFLFYLGLIFFIELTIKILILGFDFRNTSFTYPVYVFGEFLALSQMLLLGMAVSATWRWIAFTISIAIFFEAFYLWFESHNFMSGYGKVFSHLTIIILAAFLLISKIRELKDPQPIVMIYAALLLYYSVSLFLFLVMNQLTKINIAIWTLNNLLSSILYFTSIYTFYRLKKSN